MSLSINFDNIAPQSTTNLNLAEKVEVPAEVLARFASPRGLGKSVKRETEGKAVVRTIDGVTYIVPLA